MIFNIAKLASVLIAAFVLFIFAFSFGASLFYNLNSQPQIYLSAPTEAQLTFHLTASQIKSTPYDIDFYNCVEYTNAAILYLRERGIFSCLAYLDFVEGGAHTILSVELEDGQTIYIEPQTYQRIYHLEPGENYCEYVGWDCEWTIIKVSSCHSLLY